MSQRSLISLLFATSTVLLCATASAQQTKIDVTYANGTKTCTITSFDPNGVTLVTSGPNAGHLQTTTPEQDPFSGQCPSVQAPPAITVSTLTPSTTAPVVNQAFNVSFTTTNTPDYCTGEGSSAGITGWANAVTPHLCDTTGCASVNKSVTATALGSTTFVAKCYKAGQSSVTSAALSVTVGDVQPTACQGVDPVLATRMGTNQISWLRTGVAYNRTSNMQDYMDIIAVIPPPSPSQAAPTFAPWPGYGFNSVLKWSMPGTAYAAMKFDVPASVSPTMVFDFQFIQTAFGPTDKVASMNISECPGDFRQIIGARCKAQWEGNDGGVITMVADNSSATPTQACKVTRGKTYYLNFVFGELATPSTATCVGSCNLGIKTTLQQSRPNE